MSFPREYERAWREQPGDRDRLRASLLDELARALAEEAGLAPEALESSRLAQLAAPLSSQLSSSVRQWALDSGMRPRERLELAHRLGQTLDALRALEASFERGELHTARKKVGSFFTPPELAGRLVDLAFPCVEQTPASGPLSVCDPAAGGGAFLLEAARALLARAVQGGASPASARPLIHGQLYGFDQDALAVATAEVALWLYLAEGGVPASPNPRLVVVDTLGVDQPEIVPEAGFSWIIGNPPWVAFQGRAARPLAEATRRYYRARYRAFRGYPTLQALFVERALELAPHGVVALLLPSSLSDLDGYRDMRRRLTETHEPAEPLEEFGQDAFEGVVQPCFGLVARPRAIESGGAAQGSSDKWQLQERARKGSAVVTLRAPEVLGRLAAGPTLPPQHFRELGLQTNRQVTTRLLLRAPVARAPFELGLLEGRAVHEFDCGPPQLFLHVDRALLERSQCLLRPSAVYREVSFVVRQTAAFPIAALHNGEAFRNSLLAGFASAELDGALLVGLLNSALYRAIHVAGQRDARQAVFPQVKLSHLRRLPLPPADASARQLVRELSEAAAQAGGLEPSARRALDDAVFTLFALTGEEQEQVRAYLQERAPGALALPKRRGQAGAAAKARAKSPDPPPSRRAPAKASKS